MTIRTKFIVAGLVLTGAIAYLGAAGVKSGWVYYLEVDRYVCDSQYHTQRVRLHGKTDSADFAASAGSLKASFNLLGQEKRLPVVYHGVIPDQFQPGRDVVVEGRADRAGVFQADVLLTKCSSKYEPNSPHAEKKP